MLFLIALCLISSLFVFIVVVTPHGDECSEEEARKCTRRWNDFEVDGPRCRNSEVSEEISCVSQFAELSKENYKEGEIISGTKRI